MYEAVECATGVEIARKCAVIDGQRKFVTLHRAEFTL
jgi:hypothetical protein